MLMEICMTIAGFDPCGGAGLQADLKVFQTLGVYGLSAAAALTAQNTKGVFSVRPVDALFLKRQMEVLLSDLTPDAVKIGMLLTEDNVRTVAGIIKKFSLKNVVLDPVFVSSSGRRLAERGVAEMMKTKLLPLCKVITPNIHEAEALSGISIDSIKDMEKSAVILKNTGADSVIITGGHMKGNATDIFYDGSFHRLVSKKRPGEYHGTGCTFSSAVAAHLAKDNSPLKASEMAKEFISGAFRKTFSAGAGMKVFAL